MATQSETSGSGGMNQVLIWVGVAIVVLGIVYLTL